MSAMRQQMPATCDVCDGTPVARADDTWMCQRCYDLWFAGQEWATSRATERARAQIAYAAINQAHIDGYPETTIASLMNVDRMTVRRALGKR